MVYNIILLTYHIILWLWLWHVWPTCDICNSYIWHHTIPFLLSPKNKKSNKKIKIENKKNLNKINKMKRNKFAIFDSSISNVL